MACDHRLRNHSVFIAYSRPSQAHSTPRSSISTPKTGNRTTSHDNNTSTSSIMADAKQQLMDQVRQQAALQNARQLVEVPTAFPPSSLQTILTHMSVSQKLNEHCFERCVPKPGSSLSSTETTCYTHCMEKYMAAWNTVSKQYLGHVQKGVGSGQSFGGL